MPVNTINKIFYKYIYVFLQQARFLKSITFYVPFLLNPH